MDQEALADLQVELRYLGNSWDPIGVADLVSDEYDRMLGPVISRLAEGATASEMGEFMWFEVEDHFGLDPARGAADEFGAKLAAWFASRGPTHGPSA